MKTAVEILTEARSIIADPAQWATGTFARDVKGEAVDPITSDAVCFCALGALYKSSGRYFDIYKSKIAPNRLLVSSAFHLYGKSLPFVNDRLGHSAVMAVYDYAIEKAKS